MGYVIGEMGKTMFLRGSLFGGAEGNKTVRLGNFMGVIMGYNGEIFGRVLNFKSSLKIL